MRRALGEAVRRDARRGCRLPYVQRIYVPEEQQCLCLFEAPGPDLVRNINDIAQYPLARVIAVVCTAPDGSSPLADLEQDRPDNRY